MISTSLLDKSVEEIDNLGESDYEIFKDMVKVKLELEMFKIYPVSLLARNPN